MPNEKANKDGQASEKTVLVVEDDFELRGIRTRCLEYEGYRVFPTGTEREALRLAGALGNRFHALLTDLDMPKIDGMDLIQNLIRQNASIEHYIILSAHRNEESNRPPFLPSKCHEFSKSFDFNKVLDILAG